MDGPYEFDIELETSKLSKIRPPERIQTEWHYHGVFKWCLSLSKEYVNKNKKDAYLSYWLYCEPKDDEQRERSVCCADLVFRIIPHKEEFNTLPLVWSSSFVFRGNPSGWYDFYPWNLLFKPQQKIVAPDGSLKFSIHVKVLGEFDVLPPYSEKYDHHSSLYKVDHASFFSNRSHADAMVLKISPNQSILDQIPLHFKYIPALEILSDCFTEIGPSDFRDEYLERTRLAPDGKVFRLKDDVHPAAFRAIVRFFYRREIPFDEAIVTEIYSIAHRSHMVFVKKACVFLYLTIEAALPLFTHVLEFGDNDDKSMLLEFICDPKNSRKVVMHENFKNLPPHMVRYIASLNSLKIPEDTLVTAIKGWASHQLKIEDSDKESNLRKIWEYLDQHEISDHIRITLLTQPDKILPPEEMEWLSFIRNDPNCRKKLKLTLKKVTPKRNGAIPRF